MVFFNDRDIRLKSESYIQYQILDSDQCEETTIENLLPVKGFCISKKKEIDFEPSKPVEYNEFKAKKNNYIVGKYCHSCGVEVPTSINRPFCTNCQELYSLDNSKS